MRGILPRTFVAAAVVMGALTFVAADRGADAEERAGTTSRVTGPPRRAAPLPAGFFDERIAPLPKPAVTFARHSDGRIFVADKRGVVRVIHGGQVLATPVIDISDHVNSAVDRGLLGLALDKDFASNGFMYLGYVVENHGNPQSTDFRTACVTRVKVVGDIASPASETPILGKQGCGNRDTCRGLPAGSDCLSDEFTSHSLGAIRVDDDGTLWTTMGDGSLWNHQDALTRAQNLDYLNGKLLHVTPQGKGIPSNPFWNGDENAARSKVYAYGLRNPYRFNARPGGPIFLGDVGALEWEEVDVATPGANFGWPCYEASSRYRPYEAKAKCQALYAAGASAVKKPIVAYSHEGRSAGITGGAFYTGGPAAFHNAYIYADFVKRELYSIKVNATNDATTSGPTLFGTSVGAPVDIQMGPDGCLWYLAFPFGAPDPPSLRRICHTEGNLAPIARASASPNSGALPLAVQLSSAGSHDPDSDALTYLWDFGDGSTSTAPNPQHMFTTRGTRTVVLTVRDAMGATASASLKVWAGDRAPRPVIDVPAATFTFKVGDTINFSGHATDPDEGELAAARLRWRVQIVHCPGGTTDCHTHSLLDTSSVTAGSWHVDDHGDSYRFRIRLTATDSEGLATTVTREVYPQTVTIRLVSVPTGLNVVLDETTKEAPGDFVAIKNSRHRVFFPSPQSGRAFVSWSDGGTRAHDIVAMTSQTLTVQTRPK